MIISRLCATINLTLTDLGRRSPEELMKLNLTVVFTLTLLTLMAVAGAVSAKIGFQLGHAALKDVTQPEVHNTRQLRDRKGTLQPGAVTMLPEEDILTSVNKWIESKGKHPKPEKPQEEKKKSVTKPQKPVKKDRSAEATQPGFPIATQNQGVQLEVVSAHYSGGSLLMKVNFKNEGTKNVRFLYSFLSVADDQGRALSATTEGLPEDLPANGQSFSGTVSIPINSLGDVKKISMTLTDYPDQQLHLQVAEIPINT